MCIIIMPPTLVLIPALSASSVETCLERLLSSSGFRHDMPLAVADWSNRLHYKLHMSGSRVPSPMGRQPANPPGQPPYRTPVSNRSSTLLLYLMGLDVAS